MALLPGSLGTRLGAYVALTKPRIIELLLITTLPTMIVAQRGLPPVWLMVATLLGGALAAGGANAINMFVDRDIDKLDAPDVAIARWSPGRSPHGPPSSSPSPSRCAAFAELWAWVNLLSAALAISATLFYVFVYTLWLKRTSRQNIVIGGAAGAVPVLVGWAAVTDSLSWTPVVHVRDHLRVDPAPLLGAGGQVPRRLPGRRRAHAAGGGHLRGAPPGRSSSTACCWWGCPCCWRWWPRWARSTWCRPRSWAWCSWLWPSGCSGAQTPKAAMQLFSYSITYLTLLFVLMAVDIFTKH